MNNTLKMAAFDAVGAVVFAASPKSAEAAGPYSCTTEYSGSYSSCSTNNTANQSSTVATATTVLRSASTQTAGLVSGRVSSALSGTTGNVNLASNGFSASTGMSAGNMDGKLGLWASGSWSDVEDDNTATAFEGDIMTGLAGVDYEVAPGVVLGLAAGYEDVDIDTTYNGFGANKGEIDGEGWTVAPYLGVSFSDRVKMDLTAGYSDVEYDTVRFDPNTGNRITGSTDADRYFVSAGLSSTYDLQNNWSITTRGSAFYAYEDKDAFTETEAGGATINQASVDNELGQLLLDTRFAYEYQMVQPYILVGLEYDFVKDDTPVAAGQSVSDDDFGAKLGAGINLINMGNVTAGIEAYTVEFREDYNEYTVNGGLRIKF